MANCFKPDFFKTLGEGVPSGGRLKPDGIYMDFDSDLEAFRLYAANREGTSAYPLYVPEAETPTLYDVLQEGNTGDKVINLISSSNPLGLHLFDSNYYVEAGFTLENGVATMFMGDTLLSSTLAPFDGSFVTVSGGRLLTSEGDPIYGDEYARKAYVDSQIASVPAGTVTNVSSGNLSGLFTTNVATPTVTPTISYTLSSQSGYTVFARGSGSGVPSFQALVADHIPNLSAGKITSGTLPIARGGTGLGSVGTSGQMLRSNGSALEYFTPNYVSSTLIGAANGIAPLDGSGKIPNSYLPVTGMQYMGTWNASTNTPALSDGTGTDGHYYRVTVAGTQNLGSGNITFSIGDDVIHNGSVWQRAPSGAAATNLALGTITGTAIPITNSNGSGFTLPAATTTLAGLLTAADKVNYDLAYTMRHDSVTLAGQSYLSLSGQEITANQVNLASSHITGILPVGNGGTGLSSVGSTNQLLRSNGSSLEYWTPNYLTSASLTDYYTKTVSDGRYLPLVPGNVSLSNNSSLDIDAITGTSILRAEPIVGAVDAGVVMTWIAGSQRAYQIHHSHASFDDLRYRNRLTTGEGWRSWNRVASRSWVTSNTRSNTWVPTWTEVTGKPSVFAPDAHTLDSHSNVTISSPAADQYLGWSGSSWVNMTLPAGVTYTGSTSITLSGSAFQRAALTGDVTASANSNATAIAAGAVTLAKMAALDANSIIGNNTGSAATPIALTPAQVRTMLNVADGANNYTHPNSGVTGGSYNNVTVNAQGHVTEGSNVAYLVAADLSNYVTTNTQQLSIGANKGFTGHIRISPSNTTAITSEENGFRFTRIAQGVQFVVDSPAGSAAAVIRGWSEHGIQLRLWEGGIQALAASYSSGGYTYLVRNNTSGNFETRTPGISDITGLQTALDAKGAGTVTSITAGTGMNFSNITGTGSVTLGTPSNITLASTNSVSSTSHTHAFAPGGAANQFIAGDGTLKLDRFVKTTSTDLNTAVSGGVHDWASSAANLPVSSSFGTALVFVGQGTTGDGAAANTWINQIAITTGDRIFYRQSINNWSNWTTYREFWTTKHFSQSDINNWNSVASGSYVTLNTTQTVGAAKTWTGMNTWTPTINAPATNSSIMFGASAGNLPYIIGRDTSSEAFVIRTNAASGIQLSLYKGGVSTSSHGNSSQWNTAYGWGNHASAGYVPSSRELSFSAGSGLSVSGTPSTDLSVNRTIQYGIVFGSGSGQVAQGNDSRINNGNTAYSWGNHAGAGYVHSSRRIDASGSLQGGGDLYNNRDITLINDSSSPGNSKYYGTNGSGTKGYWNLPSGGGGNVSGNGSVNFSTWWSGPSTVTYSTYFWKHNSVSSFAFGPAMNHNYRLTLDGRMLVSNRSEFYFNYPSAILALESTTHGFLLPKMTNAEMKSISSPETGLMVFSTTDGRPAYYSGGQWWGLQVLTTPL